MIKKYSILCGIFLCIFLFPDFSAFGLDGEVNGKEVPKIHVALDTVWVIITAILVFFMQAGFAMVESGFTRSKNAVNIMMKNMMDLSIGLIAFWFIGFGIMFGDGNAFMGLTGFLVDSTDAASYPSLAWTSVPVYSAFFFQAVFAAVATTIVSGAVAERTRFRSYIILSVLITGIIYPVSGHWAWGGGWLSDMGFTDFAGSTVVHSLGGWAGLAAIVVLGPRFGKYGKNKEIKVITGHNIPMATLGVFILWMGWYGFNTGSTMSADPELIGHIAVTTSLSAAAGSLAAFGVTYLRYRMADVGMTLNGALAGLVGITAGCAYVSPLGAILIGAICGLTVVYAVLFFDKFLIDDPVGAVSVHGVCGAMGTILLGLFHTSNGVFYAPGLAAGLKFFGAQILGVFTIGLWAFGSTFILIKAIQMFSGLRVTEEEEFEGLDYSEHGTSAYPDFNINTLGDRHFTELPHYPVGEKKREEEDAE